MKTTLELPRPIEDYIQAVNAGDIAGLPGSFADEAVVKDLDREIRGMDAIKRWAQSDIFGVHARFEVVRVTGGLGGTVVTVKIDGTFDRRGLPDPLLMDHAFKLAHGKIRELNVTLAS